MHQMTPLFHDRLNVALLGLALLGLISGLGLWLSGQPELAGIAWTAGVLPVLAALVVEIIRSLGQGEVGLDIVAALSMSAALAFGENLAAAVVADAANRGVGDRPLRIGRLQTRNHLVATPRWTGSIPAPCGICHHPCQAIARLR